jgi:hypothetical protein
MTPKPNYMPGDFEDQDLDAIIRDRKSLEARDFIIFSLVHDGLVDIIYDDADKSVKFIEVPQGENK